MNDGKFKTVAEVNLTLAIGRSQPFRDMKDLAAIVTLAFSAAALAGLC